MVDEAHATGVLGKNGGGAVEYFGLEGRVPIIMGTLSKALGSTGGYIAGSKRLIEFLRNRARTFIFDTAPPAGAVGAAICAIEIVKSEPERREKLWRLVKRFKVGLERLGLEVLSSNSAIIPVLIRRVEDALSFSSSLMEGGVFTPAIRPPSVPHRMCRIRATLMATHTEEHIDWALRAFETAREVL